MIPAADILAWRTEHPWVSNAQVEQDLIICRAVVELFTQPLLRKHLAFRGGTVLHKLFLLPATRYSEDIDLVQMKAGAIGPVMDAVHAALDAWLGTPRRDQKEGTVTLTYHVSSEIAPIVQLRRKGRDLYDMWLGLTQGRANSARIVDVFQKYLAAEENSISRIEFERNLAQKMEHPGFLSDLPPLLRPGIPYDIEEARSLVEDTVVALL